MMEKCGHTVRYLQILEKKIKNQVHVKNIKKYNPDIVWIYTPYYISRKVISDETISYIKSKNIPIVMYSTVDPEFDYKEQMDVWSKIDFLFLHYKPMYEYLRERGLNAFYSPLGFYPDQYYKKKSSIKIHDVSFMGTAFRRVSPEEDKRTIYLQSLKKYSIGVYGESFKKRLKGISVKPFRSHEIQGEIYSKSKINLDLPFADYVHPSYNGQYHFKNRFFEIPATGNFLLTARCPEFLEIFGDDCVGYYDDNIESLKENVKRYLRDKDIRKKMSKKAYRIVHEKHTYLHRFKKMFKIIENN
jgi:spore maturation protein CgeB